jgi:hypothetical protein
MKTISNEDQIDDDIETSLTKRPKPNDEPNKDEKASDEAARRLDRLAAAAAAAAAAKLASSPYKLVKKMMRRHYIPVPKYIPTAHERRNEVN